MNRLYPTILLSVAATLWSPAHAQQPSSAPAPGVKLQLDDSLPDAAWSVPIHSQKADPLGGDYGTWAAGATFKVSFHDGFRFYPVLGTTFPKNLPLHWRTTSVRRGNAELLTQDATPKRHHTDWRYEYRFDGFTEAYDVKVPGVEQSFVFAAPPPGSGDLIVEGRVTTELRADPIENRHGGLVFRDSKGHDILTYSAAFAFDASGRRTNVATSFDGQNVRLTLDADWLRDAAYPVTIDPLTARVKIATWGGATGGQPSYPDVARDDETNELLTSYSRASSGSDYDTFARLSKDDFSVSSLVYTDVTASWSTRFNQCCFVAGADRWAIALGRQFTTVCAVRVHLHTKANRTLNSGTTMFLAPSRGFTDQTPTIGGSSSTTAYLAFRRDAGTGCPNTTTSRVYGVLVTATGNGAFGTPRLLETLPRVNYDEEWPCVTKYSYGGDWVVVWQSYDNAITRDDWDIVGQRVNRLGTPVGRGAFGTALATHKVRPKVAGSSGRYLVSYTQITNTSRTASPWGRAITVERADWTTTLTTKLPQDLSTATTNTLTTSDGNRGIAYDSNTDSHWAVAWHNSAWDVFINRVGYNGCTVEARTAYASSTTSAFSPSLTYNDDTYEFPIVFATNEAPISNQPIYGARLSYYSTAACTAFGKGCGGGGAAICYNRGFRPLPFAGSEYFAMQLSGAIVNHPYALFVSVSPGSLPLNSACTLNLGLPLLHVASVMSSAQGFYRHPIPLPDCPVFLGSVYAQWLTVQNGVTLGSRGVAVHVR